MISVIFIASLPANVANFPPVGCQVGVQKSLDCRALYVLMTLTLRRTAT